MRHAQSADRQPYQGDQERSLTPQGIKDSLLVGKHLESEKIDIQLILTSEADRAKQTAQIVCDGLLKDPALIVQSEILYQASPRTFLTLINSFDDQFHSILCVAHNPTITYLAEYLTGVAIGDMVPAGVVAIKFNIRSWQEVSGGNGELLHYTTPEMLTPY
jgi:phosphohistidine phosphatase